eukprot:gb/GEZJ01002581.1/.p2 GENE.gb/GEZJ01002581.1/~~gb/GEZJ01002581.1/.p2  ORF type:complete len:123 (-),score=3.76 gb/GEZJ01002581.1/:742-1110(-)
MHIRTPTNRQTTATLPNIPPNVPRPPSSSFHRRPAHNCSRRANVQLFTPRPTAYRPWHHVSSLSHHSLHHVHTNVVLSTCLRVACFPAALHIVPHSKSADSPAIVLTTISSMSLLLAICTLA